MARLVVVSNRVAVPDGKSGGRAGGLEVAVKATLRHRKGVWFGWSGKVAREGEPVETTTARHDEVDYVTTSLRAEDYEEYYNGFANRVLWPVLHYRFDLAEFSRRDLSGYMRVNEHFASELDKLIRPDDVIWVHDYHLMPLAKALRQRGHKNRIGYFLHIPCPPPEVLTALPGHDRLIPTLGEYDLVGFQTGDDAFNFSRYLTLECGYHIRDFTYAIAWREVRIDAFPVGIGTEAVPATVQDFPSGEVEPVKELPLRVILSQYGATTEGPPRFQLLARNDIGEALVASPALSQGRLFLRGDRHLFCIGSAGKTTEE